jgi:hypothetical protein
MSYAVQPPITAPPPAVEPGPRRPVPVTLATVVLLVMAVVGFGYAIATTIAAPGTVSRFRLAAAGADSADVDGYVSVIWIGAAIGTVLAVILMALYVVLALGLRRGSNAARMATWVVCGIGLLAGCGSTVTVLRQRSGTGDPQSLGAALSQSYPKAWIGLNLTLAVAQMAGYLVVALLLIAARSTWFGRGPAPQQAGYAAPYGPGPLSAGYAAPYGPGPLPGYPTAADQAYRPGGAASWAPGSQSASGQGQSPAGGTSAAPGQPFGLPPMGPGHSPSGPSGPPRPGPDDDYWTRPSS